MVWVEECKGRRESENLNVSRVLGVLDVRSGARVVTVSWGGVPFPSVKIHVDSTLCPNAALSIPFQAHTICALYYTDNSSQAALNLPPIIDCLAEPGLLLKFPPA